MKTILVLSDGLRPDAMEQSGHPVVERLKKHSYYTMNAQTVMPSVTLPCHMSLFFSVPPERHGILTNIYTPMVRPLPGLCDVFYQAKKPCSFFYNWGRLRDLTGPYSVQHSLFLSADFSTYEIRNYQLTDACIEHVNEENPDFVFLYLGETDAAGHNYGWMSDEYGKAVNRALDCLQKVMDSVSDDYCFVFTADHGGHNRIHGEDCLEDMTIPLFFYHKDFSPTPLENANIMDIAPTVAAMAGVEAAGEWEGKVLPIK